MTEEQVFPDLPPDPRTDEYMSDVEAQQEADECFACGDPRCDGLQCERCQLCECTCWDRASASQ